MLLVVSGDFIRSLTINETPFQNKKIHFVSETQQQTLDCVKKIEKKLDNFFHVVGIINLWTAVRCMHGVFYAA